MKELFTELKKAFNRPKKETLEIYKDNRKNITEYDSIKMNPDKLCICEFAFSTGLSYHTKELDKLLEPYKTTENSIFYFTSHKERKYVINRIYSEIFEPDYTDTIQELALNNIFNTNYQFKTSLPYENKFNLKEESEFVKRDLQRDLDILNERYLEKFNYEEDNPDKVLQGDAIRMPNGNIEYVCHVYENRIQTYSGGSFCLMASGSLSHSGTLNDPILKEDIKLTDERYPLRIWFPHKGWLQAGSAIHAVIPVRLWQHKKQIIK